MLMKTKIVLGNLGASLLFSLFWIIIFSLVPDPRGFGTHEQLFLPPCLFHWLTDLPCPACGLTTSFVHLVNGNVIQGIRAHLLGPILLGIFIFLSVYVVWCFLKKENFWLFLNSKKVSFFSVVLVFSLLVNWFLVLFSSQREKLTAYFF